MTSKNRRDFLRLAVNTVGAAATMGALPQSIRNALAIPAYNATGTIEDIQHIVILMQENRAFDHYFGTLRGVRGYGDPRPVSLPNGQSVFNQPNGTGTLLPFHPGAANLGLQFIQDLPHDWQTTHLAWDQGKWDAWVANKGTTTMAYLTRDDIPFHYSLADAFTICDGYHCSLLGPTDPNRYYMWTGWVGNDGAGGGPVISNAELGYGWTTFPEVLQNAGVSWKIYQDIGTGLNAAGSWGWTENAYIGNYGDNSLLYFNQYRNALPGTPLYDRARTGTNISAGGTLFDVLKQDVAAGTLPQVSWIVAPEAYTEHPNWPANYGAWYVEQVLSVLTSNPDLWSKTALLITYDENDGFFDHVVPPYAPLPGGKGASTVATTNEYYAGDPSDEAGPYGLGARVPMIVVSPWSRGGWVNSQTFDHTSIIRFIEARFGRQYSIPESNITPWRRAVCGDLTTAFNFRNPNDAFPTLPSTAGYAPPDQLRHNDYIPVPPATQSLPKQEQGLRPSRALPYELFVHGRVDGTSFVLDFDNTGNQGAAFHVTSNNRSDGPWVYTVEANRKLSDTIAPLSATAPQYQFSVHGPAGYLREFAGNPTLATGRAHANIEVVSGYDVANGNIALRITNRGTASTRVTVVNRYGTGYPRVFLLLPEQRIEDYWDLRGSYGWYDISITDSADASFVRRLAGRVETGRDSMSDPAIATV
ncbi:phosphocholine-specific phospholipase C [Paraburkholderia phosphatilytica]|uniref:phosphocholine-specific phospholipase C n=1 Tax=Paraburkholderia phosphatilytica TaxID=2282883 RepID=UPI000E549645|nr:phospholipase C, phosphocholine-specific [Paraburkholderia phosphatilytica]